VVKIPKPFAVRRIRGEENGGIAEIKIAEGKERSRGSYGMGDLSPPINGGALERRHNSQLIIERIAIVGVSREFFLSLLCPNQRP